MPGGMPPPPELLAGLAGREGQPGIEPGEQAGLPNPGIPGKGTDPMGKRFPQAVQPLFALVGNRKQGDACHPVDLLHPVGSAKVAFGDDQHRGNSFVTGDRQHLVDYKRIGRRVGDRCNDHKGIKVG